MDEMRFAEACRITAQTIRERTSIGLLGEKSLHAALKLYFEPHGENHEVKIGDFVADIVGENHIIEIQTGSFSKMKKKLSQFLEVTPVTVVYPIIVNKQVICLDEETGVVTSKRRSPRHGDKYSFFDEAWGIKEFLLHPMLTICLLFIEAEEYRLYGGEPEKRRKRQRSPKGYFKSDRLPTKLLDEIYINGKDGYRLFLPEGLPEEFTVRDFSSCAGTDEYRSGQAVRLLRDIGVIKQTGKRGRAYLYSIA